MQRPTVPTGEALNTSPCVSCGCLLSIIVSKRRTFRTAYCEPSDHAKAVNATPYCSISRKKTAESLCVCCTDGWAKAGRLSALVYFEDTYANQ